MFENKVMESRSGNEFRRWALGKFSSTRGGEVEISAATGVACESVRAAAWNLQNQRGGATERFLQNVLRNGVQAGSAPGGGIRFHVPGASVQVHGYEKPLSLKLEATVDKPSDASVALAMMVDSLCASVARGVYAQTNEPAEADEAEASESEGEDSIPFS